MFNKVVSMAAIASLALTSAACKVTGKWEKLTDEKIVVSGADGKKVEIVSGKGALDLSASGLDGARLEGTKVKIESSGKKTHVVLPESYKGKYLDGLTIPAADIGQEFDMSVVIPSRTYDLGADVCSSCYQKSGCSGTLEECQICDDYPCRKYLTESQAIVSLTKNSEELAKFTSKVERRYHDQAIH